MNKLAVFTILILMTVNLSARTRSITSCDEAPLLAAYQSQLPDHIMASSADTKPKLISQLPNVAIPILKRSQSKLVCVVIALDDHGKAQDLTVLYPAGFRLTINEKRLILALQWSAAEVEGKARSSLVTMDFEIR